MRLWRCLPCSISLASMCSPVVMAVSTARPRCVYVFPGRDGGKHSTTALYDALQLMKVAPTPQGPVTVHGFRTTFADWARERGKFPPDVVEHALAHSVGTKVAQAYTRSTYLEERTKMMQLWGNYCDGAAQADNVVKLHA